VEQPQSQPRNLCVTHRACTRGAVAGLRALSAAGGVGGGWGAGGNSTREKVLAASAALKYDFKGVWEHVVSDCGPWLTVTEYNHFTHRTKPAKNHSANWTIKLARV
jgi:hypothetical protein